MKKQFRHELKYLINRGDHELIRQRLSVCTQLDPNAENGEYHVRSLYFDDYWDTAYIDKLGGFPGRRKFRIRVYNCSDKTIHLESKLKQGNYIHKSSAPLSRGEFDAIMNLSFDFLLKRPENLCREFYYMCVSRVMRPRVIVDYEREPYILDVGDVRITFDKDVRAASGFDIFNPDLPCKYVLEPNKLVMEVKYTQFLPGIVKRVLPSRAASQNAVSKYALCCEKVDILSAKNIAL